MRYRAVAATVLFQVSSQNLSFSKSDGSQRGEEKDTNKIGRAISNIQKFPECACIEFLMSDRVSEFFRSISSLVEVCVCVRIIVLLPQESNSVDGFHVFDCSCKSLARAFACALAMFAAPLPSAMARD